jgi:hypothetical protein
MKRVRLGQRQRGERGRSLSARLRMQARRRLGRSDSEGQALAAQNPMASFAFAVVQTACCAGWRHRSRACRGTPERRRSTGPALLWRPPASSRPLGSRVRSAARTARAARAREQARATRDDEEHSDPSRILPRRVEARDPAERRRRQRADAERDEPRDRARGRHEAPNQPTKSLYRQRSMIATRRGRHRPEHGLPCLPC